MAIAPQNLMSTLSSMPDAALRQYAELHKNDPFIFPLVFQESQDRQQLRAAQQAQMAGQQPPKVVDQALQQMMPQPAPQPMMPPQMAQAPQGAPAPQQLPENTGIGQLPAPNLQGMAGGGIVAFDEGGLSRDLTEQILAAAKKYNIDPNVAMQLVRTESNFNPKAVNKKSGAAGLTQLMPGTAKEMGITPEERFDTQKSLDAGFGYFNKMRAKFGGDYDKALAAYNWGPGNVDKHLRKNEGVLDRLSLPKETANYLTKIMPGSVAQAATTTPSAPAEQVQAEPARAKTSNPQAPWYDRYRELMTSGEGQRAMLQGVQDVPAGLLGAPVDVSYAIANALGRKEVPGEKPTMGSKYLKDKFTALGIREADSTNPDLQTIRSGTEGIASLYSPFKTGAVQPRSAAAGNAARQDAVAAEARAAVENPRLAGPTTSTTMVQKPGYAPVINAEAKALEVADKERALAETQRASLLAKEAAAAKAPSAYTPGINPVGAAGVAASTASGMDRASNSARRNTPNYDATTEAEDASFGQIDRTGAGKGLPAAAAAATSKGGLSDLFNDPMLQMGLHLMASQNPRFLGAAGEAGLGTAAMQNAQKKEEADRAYKEALSKHYGVDPMIQRLNALQDPKTAAAYAKMKEMDREPVTKAALFKEFLASPAGMAVSMKPDEIGPAFSNYVKSYESVMGPLGGTGAGFKVLGSRPG
jgi:soluble lytic murein transglycosylase-like protein